MEENVCIVPGIWYLYCFLPPLTSSFGMWYDKKWRTVCYWSFGMYFSDWIKWRAKYALAIVNQLIDILGPEIGCAYNIGCTFLWMVENSSLSEKVKNALFQLMVGLFHGHAHNHMCQLNWYPLFIKGTGHTEGEGCEHVFSSTNDVVRGTYHATHFHCHQAIEEHFNFLGSR